MLISLDTETTGVDFAHGAKPFLITTYDDTNQIRHCEWDVDPLTRQPHIVEEDVQFFQRLIDSAELVYFHNSKFDIRALRTIGIDVPWHKVRDSYVASHLLGSNEDKNLTDCVGRFLERWDMEKYEIKVKEVTKAVRAIVKKHYPEWKIAREGDEDMPSVKGSSKRDEDKPWKADMWLTRALYRADPSKIPHAQHEEWLDACPRYANADSEYTLSLGLVMEQHIRDRGHWKHYMHRLELVRADFDMEEYGTTLIGEYTEDTIDEYDRFCAEAGAALVEIAAGYGHDLELAQGAALNDNMREFFYGAEHLHCPRCDYFKRIKHWNGEGMPDTAHCPKCLKGTKRRASVQQPMQYSHQPNLSLPIIESAKTGNATLDKTAMQEYLGTLEGEALEFIKLLLSKRKHDTDLSYMRMYQRYWVLTDHKGYFRIHPSINPCGTDHLRQSCNSPNLQNVGGQEDECEECEGEGCVDCRHTGKSRTSVKNCFGPLPDREWYSCDYRQIEDRLPMYFCDEEKAIRVFESPNSAPYWGSMYYLTASVLYPDEYWPTVEFNMDHPKGFKKSQPRLYKKAKFFNLAKKYGAGRAKGDLLSGIRNSYDLVDNEFPSLAALQRDVLRTAERTGWVHTMPSNAIDPERGYPILPRRTDDDNVLSTTPFNYYISGTACECKNLALVRCARKLAEWREDGFDGHMALEIHDEIIFDFPKGPEWDSNLWRTHELREIMEQSGKDLVKPIPTPVKVEYHARTWAEGVAV